LKLRLLQEAQREAVTAPMLPNDSKPFTDPQLHKVTSMEEMKVPTVTTASPKCKANIINNNKSDPKLSTSTQSALYYSQFSFNSNDNIDDCYLTDTLDSYVNSQTSTPPLKSTTFTNDDEINKTPSPLIKCNQCNTHKKEVKLLMEKQRQQEQEIVKLKRKLMNDYESKSPDALLISLSSTSSSSSVSVTPPSQQQPLIHPYHLRDSKKTAAELAAAIKRQNSGIIGCDSNKKINNTNNKLSQSHDFSTTSTSDWSKFWTSRPQTKPPKEWKITQKTSTNNNDNNNLTDDFNKKTNETSIGHLNLNMNAELFIDRTKRIFFANTSESIGKLIFTHFASFIVGATL
jgi:hypothetical protein